MSKQRHMFIARYGSASNIEAEYGKIDRDQKNQFLNRVFHGNPHKKGLSSEFINTIYKDDDVYGHRMNAVHHRNLSPENLQHALENRNDDQIQLAAIMHHKTTPEQLKWASFHSSSNYSRELARLRSIMPEEERLTQSENWHQ